MATRAVKLWNPAVAMAAVRRLRNLACSRAVAVANYITNPSVVQNSGPASWPSFMNYATMSARKKGGWEVGFLYLPSLGFENASQSLFFACICS